MAGSKIVIGGTSPLTLDKHVKWEFDMRLIDSSGGRAEYQDIYLNVEGDVRESTKGAVWDKLIVIQQQITSEFAPRQVDLYDDAASPTPKYSFKPSECIGSPRVINFRTIPSDGNNEMHWRYAFTIYIQKPASSQVLELQTSLFEETEKGVIIRKVTRASCRGLSLSIAKSVVLSFKPGAFTNQKLEQFPQDLRFIGTWTWDREEEQQKQVSTAPQIEEEPVEYELGARRYVETPRMDNADPVMQKRRRRATRATVRGRVWGVADAQGNQPNLSPPPAHFTESATTIRAEGEETQGAITYDLATNSYFLPYMEVWYFLSQAFSQPNHNGHNKVPSVPAPPNSQAGSQQFGQNFIV
jgi:hypothetical protein